MGIGSDYNSETVHVEPRAIHRHLSSRTPNRESETRMEPVPPRNKKKSIQRTVKKGWIILKKGVMISFVCMMMIGVITTVFPNPFL